MRRNYHNVEDVFAEAKSGDCTLLRHVDSIEERLMRKLATNRTKCAVIAAETYKEAAAIVVV